MMRSGFSHVCGMRRIPSAALLPALALFFPGSSLAGIDRWVIECADCPKYFDHLTDRSLQLDAAGHPHVAYGGDALYYAWHDGAGWHFEVADNSAAVGEYASLALDGAGRPHISYYDSLHRDLKVAYRDAAGWHVHTVDPEGESGRYTSLALSATGYPHIAYQGLAGSVRYAYQNATGWHIETVPDEGSYAREDISLALDGSGKPHISYFYNDYITLNYSIRYARRDPAGWHVEVVDDSPWKKGGHTSLALDATGKPHISYLGKASEGYDLKYARYTGTSWQIETVDEMVSDNGGYTSLALTAANQPGISYYDAYWSRLSYAYRDGSGWHTEVVESPFRGDGQTSLALRSGQPRIAYHDRVTSSVKYAVREGANWQIETVDGGAVVGTFNSLALDAAGYPHISYYDDSHQDCKYAQKQAGITAAPGNGWSVQVVAAEGSAGRFTSLDLDGQGDAHISYCKETIPGACGDLMYAYQDLAGWHLETVDSGYEGDFSSPALDQADRPHIGYSRMDVEYAYRDASGWHIEYASPATGEHSSLALDGQDHPHIVFYEIWENALWHAHSEGYGWQVEIVDAALGENGGHTSLAVDGSGTLHVSYATGYPDESLKYAYKDSGG